MTDTPEETPAELYEESPDHADRMATAQDQVYEPGGEEDLAAEEAAGLEDDAGEDDDDE